MCKEVTIKSVNMEATLKFLDAKGEHLTIVFSSAALSASQRIWFNAGDDQQFVNLFCEMAQNWRGWEGAKDWISIEGDFRLTCTSDKLGHIQLELELVGRRTPEPWFAKFTINIEAGQLEKIANQVRLLFEKR